MKNLRAARRYASALMEEVEARREMDATAAGLSMIGSMLEGSRELRRLLASPVITGQKKMQVFDALLKKRVSDTTLMFVRLLISKHRGDLLPEIVEQFSVLRDAKLGIVQAEVRSAVGVTVAQRDTLQKQLDHYTGKKVNLLIEVAPELKGGLLVRIGDTVLDASVRRQLELLRDRFVTGHAPEKAGQSGAGSSRFEKG